MVHIDTRDCMLSAWYFTKYCIHSTCGHGIEHVEPTGQTKRWTNRNYCCHHCRNNRRGLWIYDVHSFVRGLHEFYEYDVRNDHEFYE